jgi:hypothetical protein
VKPLAARRRHAPVPVNYPDRLRNVMADKGMSLP